MRGDGPGRFDNVEREATLQLHTGRAKDGSQGTRRATLLPNDLSNVARSDVEAKYGCFLLGESFDTDRFGIINQGP
jgi:hypothetical protein